MATYSKTLRLHDNIVSVKVLPPNQFSLVKAYEYVSKGVPPNKINERDRLQTPDGVDLVEDAIFLEAEVDNSTNPPVFRQQVINGVFSDNVIKIHEYETLIPFTYPGTVDLVTKEFAGSYSDANVSVKLKPPVQSEIKATVFEFVQISSTVSDSDFNQDGAVGLWRPNQWASIQAIGGANNAASAGSNPITFTASQDFRGYRLVNGFGFSSSGRDRASFNGRRVTGSGQTNNTFLDVTAVTQGPPDPIGSKFVLDIDLQPTFIGADGTTYYKKSIIVSDTIKAQTDSTLPYN